MIDQCLRKAKKKEIQIKRDHYQQVIQGNEEVIFSILGMLMSYQHKNVVSSLLKVQRKSVENYNLRRDCNYRKQQVNY